MRHPVLFGEYELVFDEKNRLIVPAEIRRVINPELHGEAFFMVIGINRMPWLYPERYYEALVEQTPQEMTPAMDLLAFDQLNFGMAARIEPDKQGRVLVPDKTLKRANLKREVTMVGVRDHLEIWNREEWNNWRAELESRSAEIAAAARQRLVGLGQNKGV